MFTGIIQEIGKLINCSNDSMTFASSHLGGVLKGDSIAVNGVCLTVISIDGNSFSADVMPETLRRSNLGRLSEGDKVNLEEALTPQSRLGGHFLQGHIDGVGEVSKIVKDGQAILISFTASQSVMRYIVEKGFIAIDGASLTVTECDDRGFTVSVVQYSRDNTILGDYQVGREVNLEIDILAKYVEKLLADRQ